LEYEEDSNNYNSNQSQSYSKFHPGNNYLESKNNLVRESQNSFRNSKNKELNHNNYQLSREVKENNLNSSNDFYGDSTYFSIQSNQDCTSFQDKSFNMGNSISDFKRLNNNNKLKREQNVNGNKNDNRAGLYKDLSFIEYYQQSICPQDLNILDFSYKNKNRNTDSAYAPVNHLVYNSKKNENRISEQSTEENVEEENEEDEEEYDESEENELIKASILKKKFSDLSEKDLLNNLISIAKDQTGCRFLQQKIDENPNFANFEIYSHIQLNISDFICDPFGNYLVQKMLDNLTTDKINQFVSSVINNKNCFYSCEKKKIK